jgi:hypothetical protein
LVKKPQSDAPKPSAEGFLHKKEAIFAVNTPNIWGVSRKISRKLIADAPERYYSW